MDMTEDDFPFYKLLVKHNMNGVDRAKREFKEACDGDLEDQYHFALKMARAVLENIAPLVPDFDEAVKQRTLMSCVIIFDEMANTGHPDAEKVARFMRDNHINWHYQETPAQPEPAAPVVKPTPRSPKSRKFSL